MSRIGKLPVQIPDKVKVQVTDGHIQVSGPLGSLNLNLPEEISVKVESNKILLLRTSDETRIKSLHGLSRSLVSNMVHGVTEGYRKSLDIVGTGYRASMDGKNLSLSVGFSHPVIFMIPDGIKVELEQTQDKQTRIKISGADKRMVGEITAKIRRVQLPEPYKGKGIRYTGERVRRKVGKTTT